MDHGRSAVETLDRSLHWPALGIALLVQLALLALMRSNPYPAKPPGPPPLQVVLIEQPAMPPIPPWPVAPRRSARVPPTPSTPLPDASSSPVSPPTATADEPPPLPADPMPVDGDALPEYRHAGRERGDARRFGRSTATLPGSSEAVIDIGAVVRTSRTPQQTVALVGALLFGGRPPEPCEEIERRIIHSDDPTVRQLELDKLDRCRRR